MPVTVLSVIWTISDPMVVESSGAGSSVIADGVMFCRVPLVITASSADGVPVMVWVPTARWEVSLRSSQAQRARTMAGRGWPKNLDQPPVFWMRAPNTGSGNQRTNCDDETPEFSLRAGVCCVLTPG